MISYDTSHFQSQGLSTLPCVVGRISPTIRRVSADQHTARPRNTRWGDALVLTARKPCGVAALRTARLDLLGPIRLTDGDGTDRTPRSALRQAILGIVALAGDTGVSRARLQDLLWGDKEPKLAAQSLRTALHGLRRDLDAFDPPLIDIDPVGVRLAPRGLSVDLLDFSQMGTAALPLHVRQDPPDVMEGIDVSADGFEDWLRDQRIQWHERIAEAESSQTHAAIAGVPPNLSDQPRIRPPVVGILQPVIQARSAASLYLGEALADRVAEGLRDYVGARIVDFRDAGFGDDVPAMADSPDIYLRFRLYEVGDRVSLRAVVLDRSSTRLLWSIQRDPIDLIHARIESPRILELLGELTERLAGTLVRQRPQDGMAPITPFHALTAMFRLDHSALEDLRDELSRAWALTDEAIYPAILAYMNSFRVGEHWHPGIGALAEDTRRLASHVSINGEHGGLALGLVGHALGYVLQDHDGAADLLDRAVRLSPHSAFCWDHLALHGFYNGQYDRAKIASRNALSIGAFSPIAFTMQTTRSMIATLQGDFDTAADLGARVLSRRANFGAALRYMSITKAHLGDIDGARDCVRRIREMDPDFSVDWVQQDRMAVRDETAKAILTDGLVLAGAK